jgi:hypothetical protein
LVCLTNINIKRFANKVYLLLYIIFRANGQLGGKRKNEEDEQSHFKPDHAVFVKQRSLRLDLSCAEAKSPVNTAIFPKSDLVKIGQEMKWMLNKIIREGVEMPVVGGVLATGFNMYIRSKWS